jgi:hypothetical protein
LLSLLDVTTRFCGLFKYGAIVVVVVLVVVVLVLVVLVVVVVLVLVVLVVVVGGAFVGAEPDSTT